MKLTDDVIHELARLVQTDRTVLSAYLTLANGWDAATTFVEKESTRLSPFLDKEEKDYFEASLSFLFDYIKERKATAYAGPGLAFFADLGADFTRGVELVMPPEALLAVDDEAVIAPLALQLDEYGPVGIIAVDAAGAKVYVAAGRVAQETASFRENIHHLSKVGGWSQMRYQRRRAKEVERFAGEVASEAEEIFRTEGVDRVLLAGRDRMVGAVEEELPPAWRDRVIASVRWDLDAGEDELLAKIRPALEEAERQEEANLIARYAGELRRGGLALAGAVAAERALQMGAVDTVLVGKAFYHSKAGAPEVVEKLASLAEVTGAHVEFVASEEGDALASGGHVGVLLRFRISPAEGN
jgi:peptide chain release factor subunit 1